MVIRLYRKIINTQPVVFLDFFKAITVFLTATGIITITSSQADTLIGAAGFIITSLLSWLTHNSVSSNETTDKIRRSARLISLPKDD